MTYSHGSFSWVDVVTKDYAEAVRFYGALFGWTCTEARAGEGQETPYGLFRLDGKNVAGIGEMSAEMKANGNPCVWNNYVTVDDIDETLAAVTEGGGAVLFPRTEVTAEGGALAFFTDPEGAVLALWEAGAMTGSEVRGCPGTFCRNEFNTRNLAKASAFYGTLFGWQFVVNPDFPGMYRLIENNGARNGGMLQMNADWGDMPAHWMTYFQVDDVDAACSVVTEAGGKVCFPPFDVSNGRIGIIQDPSGAVFTIFAGR